MIGLKMKVIKSEQVVFFDVDNTLVYPAEKYKGHQGALVEVYDAVTKKHVLMRVNEPNMRLLLEEKHRGSFVIVWSRGGYEWAANVLRALDLESKVDLVMSKPLVYYDDLSIDEWLTYRVFLEPNTLYKKLTTKGE
jgi:hypothetical protein